MWLASWSPGMTIKGLYERDGHTISPGSQKEAEDTLKKV